MKKVLIIEDDGDTLEMLGYIASQADVEVVLQSDVIPVTTIQQIKPDLIILDHWIGTKRGGDLCLEIKQTQVTKHIPVILLSALNEIGQIAIESRADGCLTKPFDMDEIIEVIECYLG